MYIVLEILNGRECAAVHMVSHVCHIEDGCASRDEHLGVGIVIGVKRDQLYHCRTLI